ncbi:MAG: hypothetical protein R6V72_03300, partial [Cyclobacterium sp.]|uniref:hypothetical protein n=1 Tax=Cyclobacterium sp. TaxID=1966343 RepID=UPI0039710106
KSNATNIDRNSGIVKWELDLAAQETETICHGFTIQYPIGNPEPISMGGMPIWEVPIMTVIGLFFHISGEILMDVC